MGFTITLTNNHLTRIAAELRPKASAIVRKTAFQIEADAKQRAAVDTGAMRGSIQAVMDTDLEATIAVGVDYAAYVEYGTYKMPAQPYMTPAAEAARPSFDAAFQKIAE